MPTMNIPEEQVVELAKQLPPATRRALGVALLREEADMHDLDALRAKARPELARLLKAQGLDMDHMSAGQIDDAIRQICEER